MTDTEAGPMSTHLQKPNDLNDEILKGLSDYSALIDDIIKLTTILIVVWCLYGRLHGGSAKAAAFDCMVVEIYSMAVIGLFAYHLLIKGLIRSHHTIASINT